VGKRMARGLVTVNERSEDGGPFLETVNEERVAHVQPSVGIVLGESPAEQPGTLYVTTRRLVWLSDEDVHKGYAVDFLSLTMHAISRDEDAYPQPCIYSQVRFETFLSPKMRNVFWGYPIPAGSLSGRCCINVAQDSLPI
jgi:nucleotide-sensitive chloride channel 1A